MKFSRTKVAQFQEQNCELTLKEALEEFYAVNKHILSKPVADTKWTELLVHHDVSHVFFGVNTSVLDETVGDYWTLFASDLTFKEHFDYANTPEGKKVFNDVGLMNMIKALIMSLPLLFQIYTRSRKMTCKWKSRGYEPLMSLSLQEIRSQHNLKILHYN